MTRKPIVPSLALLLAFCAAPVLGDSWTGWITDEQCGAAGAKAEHKGCAEKCHKEGIPLAFYDPAEQKLYKIDQQEQAKKHLGHEVKVTGTVDGDKIVVESIAAAAKS